MTPAIIQTSCPGAHHSKHLKVKRFFNNRRCAFLALVAMASLSATTQAATRTVTNLKDAGPGSLRQAIANATTGDLINFSVAGTIVLTGFELDVAASRLTIRGPGAKRLAVSGNGSHRIFNVLSGADVSISGLTLRNGNVSSGGAAIYNGGSTTLSDCTVAGNRGGGIRNGGMMKIRRCTIANNLAENPPGGSAVGGGIWNDGALTISASTVANNEAVTDNLAGPQEISGGGGIFNSMDSKSLTVSSCTISGNRVTGGQVGQKRGGGISNYSSVSAIVRNTIVAGNIAARKMDVDGPFTSDGYNLIGNKAEDGDVDPGGGFQDGVKHDQVGGGGQPVIDARLNELANNGGPTFTMSLQSGSPAIDQGRSLASRDQRGFRRHHDFPAIPNAAAKDSCDIGAFERGSTFP